MIVPCLLGSQIQGLLNNSQGPHWYCRSRDLQWFLLYIDALDFLPDISDCWLYNMNLSYTSSGGGIYSSPPGVQTRIADYGNLTAVAYLDANHKIPMWQPYIAALQQLGYTPGLDLVAAPYDWRLGPTMYAAQFELLGQLVEDTYTRTGGKPVALLSLSMGI